MGIPVIVRARSRPRRSSRRAFSVFPPSHPVCCLAAVFSHNRQAAPVQRKSASIRRLRLDRHRSIRGVDFCCGGGTRAWYRRGMDGSRAVVGMACFVCVACGGHSSGVAEWQGGTVDGGGDDARHSGGSGGIGAGGSSGAGGLAGSGGSSEDAEADADCVEEGATCGVGKVCHHGACVDGCFIDGSYYPSGDSRPGYPCLLCSAEITTDWTPTPRKPCFRTGWCASNGDCSGASWITAGANHTCLRTTEGGALCWGSNAVRQLGSSPNSTSVPNPVSALGSDVVDISAGADHTCAVIKPGVVLCWGSNQSGQIGNNGPTGYMYATYPYNTDPAVVSLGPGVHSVSAGESHTCALGGPYCWGNNEKGAVGASASDVQAIPVPVSGATSGQGQSSSIFRLSAGGMHTCAIESVHFGHGSFQSFGRCWGDNSQGQLGNGTTISSNMSVGIANTTNLSSVSSGYSHTCAIADNGASCWGNNSHGQLGDGTTVSRSVPTLVQGLDGLGDIVGVAAGKVHTCAVTQSGAALCWGDNSYGQLGDGTTTAKLIPTQVKGLASGVAAITTGHTHTCALMLDGAVFCWGGNAHGQIGDGTKGTDRVVPTPVVGFP